MADDWWDQYSEASRKLAEARSQIVTMEREHKEALAVARVDVHEAQSLAKIAKATELDPTEHTRIMAHVTEMELLHATIRFGLVLAAATVVAVMLLT